MTRDAAPEPSLEELQTLFQLGDYRRLRTHAETLRKEALARQDQETVKAVDALLERLRPDPTGAQLYLIAFALLFAIAALTYGGGFH